MEKVTDKRERGYGTLPETTVKTRLAAAAMHSGEFIPTRTVLSETAATVRAPPSLTESWGDPVVAPDPRALRSNSTTASGLECPLGIGWLGNNLDLSNH